MKEISLTLLLTLLTSPSHAELPTPQTVKSSPGSIEVLKNDFFDSKSELKSQKNDSRYDAGEPSYNSEQREQWLKACDKYKNKDLETYRKCFQDEKSKAEEALKRKFDEVERRQSTPLRNVNPLLEEQERNMNSQDEE